SEQFEAAAAAPNASRVQKPATGFGTPVPTDGLSLKPKDGVPLPGADETQKPNPEEEANPTGENTDGDQEDSVEDY
ncbi:hypothetical protein K2X33_01570, partial [bacterium]|nr:hypothetical protein [bacterium]